MTEEWKERFQVGCCRCCGQTVTLSQPAQTMEDADAMATMECTCVKGEAVRLQANERKTLQEVFPDISPEAGELLCQVAHMIRSGDLYSGTNIKVAENVVAKFKINGAAVIITRVEKREHQRSI